MFYTDSAADILNKLTTRATYVGRPIVVVGDTLVNSGDYRYQVLYAYLRNVAAKHNGVNIYPTFFLNTDDAFHYDKDVQTVTQACVWLSRFEQMDHISRIANCGPIFSMPLGSGTEAAVKEASWALSAQLSRVSRDGTLGIGEFGIGAGDPYVACGPIIYAFPHSNNNVIALDSYTDSLFTTWRTGGVATASDYARLAATEILRPGFAARMHPALTSYALLTTP